MDILCLQQQRQHLLELTRKLLPPLQNKNFQSKIHTQLYIMRQ